VPPTIKSKSADSISSIEGFILNSPFILATLTSDIGWSKGMSEIVSAADAANAAKASGG